jgi:putative ABC transport system permease protein
VNNKFVESIFIALDAIWGAKLRSLMTVLGNIVAVTSIIAVVSMIQGLNASVKQAILNQAGADSFNIQQFPITRSDEEFDKIRANPRITMLDARAIRRYSDLVTAVMADSSAGGRISYRDSSEGASTRSKRSSRSKASISGWSASAPSEARCSASRRTSSR